MPRTRIADSCANATAFCQYGQAGPRPRPVRPSHPLVEPVITALSEEAANSEVPVSSISGIICIWASGRSLLPVLSKAVTALPT
jgi:hypothetical protein